MSLLDIFTPNPDAALLSEAGGRWLSQQYRADTSGFSEAMWQTIAAQGWTALRLPEEAGGLGLPLSACLPLVSMMGAAGLREPLIESALVAAPLAAQAGADPAMLQVLAEGNRIVVLWDDLQAPVIGGNEITDLLFYDRDAEILSLCTVGAAQSAPWQGMDGRRLSDRARPADGLVLLRGSKARDAVALARADRFACLAAEGCGAMGRALSLTAAYLKERRQFGKPLAQFQVLQHRLADMLVECELALSLAAILQPTDTPPPEALSDRAVAGLVRSFRIVGEAAVQLHGGMGMTDEMEIGRVFKRLLHLATALGGETAPRARVTRALAQRIDKERRA